MKLADIPNPTPVFFQPARYVPMLAKDYGVTVFFGPEVENSNFLAKTNPAELARLRQVWVDTVAAAGAACVLKNPVGPLPDCCVGVLMDVDEPNSKQILPATLKANSDDLRARYPGVPVFLSLYGGTITSANYGRPAELQLAKDYFDLADVFTVDSYSMNVNAKTHPTTWTGDAVAKARTVTNKPIWAWVEMNDQQLKDPKPADGFNRAPTPDEIRATVDYAVSKGATGVGWFATCQRGSYGWALIDPLKGDNYWPLIDRTGASILPQLEVVKAIGLARKPAPPPVVVPPVPAPTPLESLVAAQAEKIATVEARLKTMQVVQDGQTALVLAYQDYTADLQLAGQSLGLKIDRIVQDGRAKLAAVADAPKVS